MKKLAASLNMWWSVRSQQSWRVAAASSVFTLAVHRCFDPFYQLGVSWQQKQKNNLTGAK